MSIKLKGMTWDHSRGYDPMVATSAAWGAGAGVAIAWDKRSLKDFESFSVAELARQYDLIVIDHPHVGQITAEHCLAPFDGPGRAAELEDIAHNSVGKSFASYTWQGHQWALPIDAAAQVMAYRADLIERAPASWPELMALGELGQLVVPMLEPHGLIAYFTLAANLGTPCATLPGDMIGLDAGIAVYDRLAALAAHLTPSNFAMDPIAASEALARSDAVVSVMPFGYGYASYARAGFRDRTLTFADIPVAGSAGPVGSVLGGTGIAVSAYSQHREQALDYAYSVAGSAMQTTLYAGSGGQPGHASAWEDDEVNLAAGDFYRNTRATLEGAWVRPRHDGYMGFQERGARRLNAGLLGGEPGAVVVADLNRLYRGSFGSPKPAPSVRLIG